MSDCMILEQLRAGSEPAIDLLDECYGEYCRAIAFRILRSEEDVRECLNDVYWKIWNAAKDKDISDLKHYVAGVTRNVAIDIYNKRKNQENILQESDIQRELEECFWPHDDSATITDAIVIRDVLNAFLCTLSRTERWVFMRRYWNMDSIKQIAAACGKREEAIRKMLSRTRQKLKIRLEKEGVVI